MSLNYNSSSISIQIESLDQLNDKLNVFLGAYNEIEKLNQMDLVFFKVSAWPTMRLKS